MSHLVPMARWYGFGFGYCVAEAVALTECSISGGPWFAVQVARYLNGVLVLFAVACLARVIFGLWRAHSRSVTGGSAATGRAAAGLGTFAKSDSHDDAASIPAELNRGAFR
jgi:hypothetical protein